jgi:uncharacterized protein
MENISKEYIIEQLRNNKNLLRNRFAVEKIGLFGSYSKGLESADSDIDFVVEFTEPKFDYISGLMIYLENIFHRKIEIIRKSNNIKSKFLKKIESEILYV